MWHFYCLYVYLFTKRNRNRRAASILRTHVKRNDFFQLTFMTKRPLHLRLDINKLNIWRWGVLVSLVTSSSSIFSRIIFIETRCESVCDAIFFPTWSTHETVVIHFGGFPVAFQMTSASATKLLNRTANIIDCHTFSVEFRIARTHLLAI